MGIHDLIASWQSWLLVAIIYFIGSLIWPLVFPTIITYPWACVKQKEPTTVVLAGSFNPPHRGHYAMLKYLSERHAKVVCVVGCNPNKKYDVTPEDRARLIRTMLLADLPDVEVQIVTTYIWRYAKKRGCRIMYRGIRTWEKDGKEEHALHILNTWGPLVLGPTWPIPSRYLEGQPEYNHISSTLIRKLLLDAAQENTRPIIKAELAKLIPEAIVDDTMALYIPNTDKQVHKT
jgi:pantetheine-phosphate adenylyltransferase